MTRARLLTSRLATFVASLLAASAVIFALVNLLPGDVATAILGDQADTASLQELRQQLGLDRPVWLRYLDWLGGLATGDLGVTAHSRTSIASLVAPRLGLTLWLVGLGMLLAIAVAFPLGMFAAVARRRWSGFAASAVSLSSRTIASGSSAE